MITPDQLAQVPCPSCHAQRLEACIFNGRKMLRITAGIEVHVARYRSALASIRSAERRAAGRPTRSATS